MKIPIVLGVAIILLSMSGCVTETSVFENPYEDVNWDLQYAWQGAHVQLPM